jgi:hypothetical protein
MDPSALPRRLLVSPAGTAHQPTCRSVPATAESGLWGELQSVAASLALIEEGVPVASRRRGTMPGPQALRACGCLTEGRRIP